MNERLAKAEALFHEALELPPKRRESFLQAACGEDVELLREVTALLRASGIADEWLKDADCAAGDPRESERSREPEGPGAVTGRYKLLEKIGEGGFGAVYMAEQREPVCRKVALKIIKLGMDTKSVIARFEAERQALALMDHPNIAKVLDAGATDTGRPYFVMELVRGLPITTFCEQNQLGLNQRLELLIQVCSAIQHAHQKGIIHRDIKPTNVLVTSNDSLPHPMVIDFGVAKALNQRLTEKTLFTNFAQMIGTPAYMSPEQAELSKLDVDTRSDIYSLGVLLYELLTGNTPFDGKQLFAAGLDEMRRIIREVEPVKPSTRLTQECHAHSLVSGKSAIGNRQLTVDLDWIVMKCLEKDRTRRYDTASALALDIQRHLKSEPVLARPPSNLYRFQKLVRRHRLAFAAAGAVTMALVLGLAGSTWMFLRERQARQLTRQAEHRAQTEIAKRQEIAAVVQQMRRLLGDDDLEIAGTLVNLAVALHKKGKLDLAEEALLQALTIQSNQNAELDQARSLECLGLVLQDQGKLDGAERAYLDGLAFRKKVLGNVHPTVFDALNRLAGLLINRNKYAEAVPLLQEAGDGGSIDAQLMLTQLHHTGRGVKKDSAEAVGWLRKAAAQESSIAEYQLGWRYATGEGVALDLVEAARWYRKAAEQGRFVGIVSLARMYATGRGVPKDPEEAKRWMRKADEAVERCVEANDLHRLNLLARELATRNNSDVRDGAKAVELAERLVRLSDRKVAAHLDTLAAAYAEAGKFEQAVAVQMEALSLVKDNLKAKEEFTVRLRLYQTNTPYRVPVLGTVVLPE